MLIGVPKEIKNHEYRIGLTPSGARELVSNGHQVIVQRDGGKAIGLTDEQYVKAGAQIVDTAEEIFARADMIIKVKEPQPNECAMLRPGQVLYTYLHLAPDPEQTKALVASGATCIAYETVTDRKGGLPLLAPMWKWPAACRSRQARMRWRRRRAVPACCSAACRVLSRPKCW